MKRVLFSIVMILFSVVSVDAAVEKDSVRKSKDGYIIGKVVDELGEPFVGAYVVRTSPLTDEQKSKGFKERYIVGLDGYFEVPVDGKTELKITFVRYKSKTIKAKGGKLLKVSLVPWSRKDSVKIAQKPKPDRGGKILIGVRPWDEPDPLYVLDGKVVTSEDLCNEINPSDIKSVNVLKMRSPEAMKYGRCGAAGVAIIESNKHTK